MKIKNAMIALEPREMEAVVAPMVETKRPMDVPRQGVNDNVDIEGID